MSGDPFRDIPVWRDLVRLMPGWQPTLRGLQRLDEGPNELLVALRAIAREWSRDDARWDVLQGVLEYYKRQHAHELAEKVMALRSTVPDLKARQVFKNGYDAALMVAALTISEEAQSERRRCGWEQAHESHRWIQNGVWYLCSTVVLNSE